MIVNLEKAKLGLTNAPQARKRGYIMVCFNLTTKTSLRDHIYDFVLLYNVDGDF